MAVRPVAVFILALLIAACGGMTPSPTPPSTPLPTPSPSPAYRLVEVGERRLALDCRGEGPVTVVLVSGLGVLAETWAATMEPLAAGTRVCRYDRPGLGESSSLTPPRTSDAVVAERGAPTPSCTRAPIPTISLAPSSSMRSTRSSTPGSRRC